MPRIPDASALGVRPTPESNRPLSGYRGGIAEAAAADEGIAAAKLGQAVTGIGEKLQDRQDNLDLAAANSTLIRSKIDLDKKYEDDPDYTTWADRYGKDLGKVKQDALAGISNPTLRAKASIAADDVIARSVASVQERARKKSLDATAGWTLDFLDKNKDAALRTDDTDAQTQLLLAGLHAVNGAVGRGAMTAEEAERYKERYREGFAEAVLQSKPADQQLRMLMPQRPADGAQPPPDGKPALDTAITDAATKNGVDPGTLKKIAVLESGGRPDAVNPSGASGPFQFMPATAKRYGLDNPQDAGQSADAAARLLKDNKADLTKSLGRDPTPAELYLAHQQGAAGAAALIQNPDKPAIDALADVYGDIGKARAAVLQNGGSVDMSGREFAKMWTDRFNKAPGAAAPAAGTPSLADLTPNAFARTGTFVDFLSPDKRQKYIDSAQAKLRAEDARRKEQFSAAFTPALDQARNAVLANPSEFGTRRLEMDDAIANSGLAPQHQTAFRAQAYKGLALSAAQAEIDDDPVRALLRINSGQWDSYLDADAKHTLINSAQTETRRIDERRAQLADKELKRLGDEEAKRLDTLDADGKLTRDEINRSSRYLSPAEYRHFLSRLGPDKGEDDLKLYADLNSRLDREDISGEVVRAQETGHLKTDTAKSLIERNRQALRDDQPASPYKSGRELVKTTLDPGQLLSGPAERIARAGMAQAMEEFDNWTAANPIGKQGPNGATIGRADYLAQAQDVIRRYQIVSFDQMSLATGLPRSYAGTREGLKPTDLDAAERQTITDLDGNRITREMADQELRKIETWREILRKKPAPGQGGKK